MASSKTVPSLFLISCELIQQKQSTIYHQHQIILIETEKYGEIRTLLLKVPDLGQTHGYLAGLNYCFVTLNLKKISRLLAVTESKLKVLILLMNI